jgi:hypothetical protein
MSNAGHIIDQKFSSCWITLEFLVAQGNFAGPFCFIIKKDILKLTTVSFLKILKGYFPPKIDIQTRISGV